MSIDRLIFVLAFEQVSELMNFDIHERNKQKEIIKRASRAS